MRIRVDDQFLAEASALELRYRCPDCAYFLPAARGDGGTCAHEWPNECHLALPTVIGEFVDFCKEFESA